MSRADEESAIISATITDFINIHNKGIAVFNDLIKTSNRTEDLKNVLSMLVNTYFFETSLLFRMASVSMPAIIDMKNTLDKLPDRDEFHDIKKEANSQYDKVKQGIELIKQVLGGAKEQDKRGGIVYG
jgi:hypothetical protein